MEVGLEQCQNGEVPMTDNENSEVGSKNVQLDTGGKKDSFRRRYELMVEGGLAEVTQYSSSDKQYSRPFLAYNVKWSSVKTHIFFCFLLVP